MTYNFGLTIAYVKKCSNFRFNQKKGNIMKLRYLLTGAALLIAVSAPASAVNIAVFGDNATDNFINSTYGAGSATLVSDAQLATAGFLSPFNAFFMTRNGSSFGVGLSAAAAANVNAYVGATGAVILMNCDCADGVGSEAFLNQLFTNAVDLAAASGHGYIGEFNGAVSALTANGNGFNPIGLITGIAGSIGFGGGGSAGSFTLSNASPLLTGLTLPKNSGFVEFGASITGVNSALVVARYDGEGPALIFREGIDRNAVPEPVSLGLVGLGLAALGWSRRKKA